MYITGWNMPGYMPEMEPTDFSDRSDAMHFLAEDLQDLLEHVYAMGEEEDEEIVISTQSEVFRQFHEGGDISVYLPPTNTVPSGIVYWMVEEDEEDE